MSEPDVRPTAVSSGRLTAVEVKADANETLIAWMLSTAKKLGLVNVVVLVGFVGFIAGATLYAARAQAQDMKAISDAGVGPLTERFERHLQDDAESRKDQKEFNREALRLIGELAADNRANYRATVTGERQQRMERPLPILDGGP